MCGICGYINTKTDNNFAKIIEKMIFCLNRRGPDDNGNWIDPQNNLALGHTRLSIFDLSSKGRQPMSSASERFIITFNGEIYNFLELKKILINKGCKFYTETDTEVLLNLFEYFKFEKSLSMIEGMFAFALWDKKFKKLYLARDRFGEKPLYYYKNKNDQSLFIFASELKSLISHPNFVKKINKMAASLMLRYSYVPSPLSIYENVFKIQPGHFLEIDVNDKKLKFNTPRSWIEKSENFDSEVYNDEKKTIQTLEDLLVQNIGLQKQADVNVGVFLSGGIDSTLIATLMQKLSNNKIETFNISLNEKSHDESEYANFVAKSIGSNHNKILINKKKALEIIPELPQIYCEPFADSSQIPTTLISSETKNKVTVALTGDAADELFGGYNRYKYAPQIFNFRNKLPNFLVKFINNYFFSNKDNSSMYINNFLKIFIRNSKINKIDQEKILKILKIFSKNTKLEMFLELISIKDNFSNFQKYKDLDIVQLLNFEWDENFSYSQNMMNVDIQSYLPDDILVKVDRAAMYYGLETRVPYLSKSISTFAKNLPLKYKIKNNQTKWILRKILEKNIDIKKIDHPKTGFSIPLNNWLKEDLKSWSEKVLSKSNIEKYGYLNYEKVNHLRLEHLKSNNYSYTNLWNIIMFQTWLENYL